MNQLDQTGNRPAWRKAADEAVELETGDAYAVMLDAMAADLQGTDTLTDCDPLAVEHALLEAAISIRNAMRRRRWREPAIAEPGEVVELERPDPWG